MESIPKDVLRHLSTFLTPIEILRLMFCNKTLFALMKGLPAKLLSKLCLHRYHINPKTLAPSQLGANHTYNLLHNIGLALKDVSINCPLSDLKRLHGVLLDQNFIHVPSTSVWVFDENFFNTCPYSYVVFNKQDITCTVYVEKDDERRREEGSSIVNGCWSIPFLTNARIRFFKF